MPWSFINSSQLILRVATQIQLDTIVGALRRKRSRKQQHEPTSKKLGRHTHASRRQRPRQQPTLKHTLPSPPPTSPVKATSSSWTRNEATRTTIPASECPSVATPSRTRWAHSPRTSQPNLTTTHAAPGRSAWWVSALLTKHLADNHSLDKHRWLSISYISKFYINHNEVKQLL